MAAHGLSSFTVQHDTGWQTAFESIFHASDRKALFLSVERAEPLILLRRDALLEAGDRGPEWDSIEKALGSLRALKEELLDPRSSATLPNWSALSRRQGVQLGDQGFHGI